GIVTHGAHDAPRALHLFEGRAVGDVLIEPGLQLALLRAGHGARATHGEPVRRSALRRVRRHVKLLFGARRHGLHSSSCRICASARVIRWRTALSEMPMRLAMAGYVISSKRWNMNAARARGGSLRTAEMARAYSSLARSTRSGEISSARSSAASSGTS